VTDPDGRCASFLTNRFRSTSRKTCQQLFAPPVMFSLAMTCMAATACYELVDPPLPASAASFTPPSYYATWWSMTEACSGTTGDFAKVQWYSVPIGTDLLGPGREINAYWSEASNRIVLTSATMVDGGVVRHEMLHALIRVGGHPRTYFLDKCGGTVHCEEPCVRDAGAVPTPPSATPRVPADSFDVSVEVSSMVASQSDLAGYFSLTVLAHNGSSHAVIASLPTGVLGTQIFGYNLLRSSIDSATAEVVDGDVVIDPGVLYFAAGQTKRRVFDFLMPDAYLTPGPWYAVGRFGPHRSAAQLMTIVP
jgi:hypothetical protein